VARQHLLPPVLAERLRQLRRGDDIGEDERLRRAPRDELFRAAGIPRGAEALEEPARRGELLLGALLVADIAVCLSEGQPVAGDLVRRVDLPPGREGAPSEMR
jgi:hypothetical protein